MLEKGLTTHQKKLITPQYGEGLVGITCFFSILDLFKLDLIKNQLKEREGYPIELVFFLEKITENLTIFEDSLLKD